MQKDKWSRRIDWIKEDGPSGITYVPENSLELYNENRIIAVGDIYFRLNKYLTGITFTYVNSLEDIYKRDIMTGDGYSIVCMYNEYDVIDRAMKNIIFVDVASDVNINLNYVGRDGKIYPQQWKVIDGVKLKSGHLVLLKNQDNDIENDIYVVTNKHFLENTNYLSTREKSNKFSCSVKLGTNADKQYFLSGSTALASINNGYGFPISFEPKTFIKGNSYIIKHLISYNLYNTLRGNQQIIELNSGFNIVSFNMTPINPDIKAIFQPFIDYGILINVVDENNNELELSGGVWINNIGDVIQEDGYLVYITRPATLTVTGTQIVLPIEINLTAGWNIMSYPAQKSQNAFSVVQPLINEGKLISVQDEVGNVIMNSGDTWFNYIGNFIPGKGYRIQVSENCVLQINESEENISTSKIIFTDYELARRQVDDNFELYNNFYVKIDSSSIPSKYITMIYHRDKPYIIRHDIESNSVVTGSISNIINTKSGTIISGITSSFNIDIKDYIKINFYSGSTICLTLNTFVKELNSDYLVIQDMIPNSILIDLKNENYQIINLNIANDWTDFITNKIVDTPYSNFYSIRVTGDTLLSLEFSTKEYPYDKYFDYCDLNFYFVNDTIYKKFETLNQFVEYKLYDRLNDIDPIIFNTGFTFFNNYLLTGFRYEYTKSNRIRIVTFISGLTNIFKPYTYVVASAVGSFPEKTLVYEVHDSEIIIEKPKNWILYSYSLNKPELSIQNIDGLKNISDILYEVYMNQSYDGGWYIQKPDNERKYIAKIYAKMLDFNETFRSKVTGILYENKNNEFILKLYDLEHDSNLYFSPIELIYIGSDRKSRLPVPLSLIEATTSTTTFAGTTSTTTYGPTTTTHGPTTTTSTYGPTTTTTYGPTTTTTHEPTTTTTTYGPTTTTTYGPTTTTTTHEPTTTTTTHGPTTTTTTHDPTTTTTTHGPTTTTTTHGPTTTTTTHGPTTTTTAIIEWIEEFLDYICEEALVTTTTTTISYCEPMICDTILTVGTDGTGNYGFLRSFTGSISPDCESVNVVGYMESDELLGIVLINYVCDITLWINGVEYELTYFGYVPEYGGNVYIIPLILNPLYAVGETYHIVICGSECTTTTTTTEPPCEGCSGVLTVGDLSSMFGEGYMGYFDGGGGSVNPYPMIIPEGEVAVIMYVGDSIAIGNFEGPFGYVTEIIINGVSYEIIGGYSDTVDNPFVIGNSYDICINYITCPPRCDYGLLYNFFAVDTGKLAPTGWLVPSEVEWTTLRTYLGGEEIAGGKLKSTETGPCDWESPNTGATNESGFSGLPGGFRYSDGSFNYVGYEGTWWSSSEDSTPYAWNRILHYNDNYWYYWNIGAKEIGSSVRCMRDSYEGWENDVPVVDYDGNEYDVVEIGTQLWLVQNLKVTHYNDGEAIPNVEDDTTWAELTTGALCAYDNDWETYACVDKPTTTTTTTVEPTTTTTTTDEPTTTTTTTITIESYDFCVEYGALYNWWAATDVRNIAPAGWHVSNESDFDVLVAYLGGLSVAGNKLREIGTIHWQEPNSGATNEVGFNGRGGNYRYDNGSFYTFILKSSGVWWTTTEYDANTAWYYNVYFAHSSVGKFTYTKKYGNSIRIVKDSTTLTHGQTGTYTGNDGKMYRTICIGTQEWVADNLAETKYRNGDLISNHGETYADKYTDAEWAALTTEAMCYYEDDFANVGVYEACPTTTTTTAEPTTTTTTSTMEPTTTTTTTCDPSKCDYGLLYNWYAVDTSKLAPTGWHVPTDAEWTTLTTWLTDNGYGYEGSGTDIAKSMASQCNWLSFGTFGTPGNDPGTNNSSGFSGLPGSNRYGNGDFGYVGYYGYWWSSTESSTSGAWSRGLSYFNANVSQSSYAKEGGLSVRCLRDSTDG